MSYMATGYTENFTLLSVCIPRCAGHAVRRHRGLCERLKHIPFLRILKTTVAPAPEHFMHDQPIFPGLIFN